MPAAATVAVNHWPDSACARAFWGQQHLAPYQKLLADTAAWLEPRPGQRWLDLGCGCGQLTRALWNKCQGQVGSITGLDCAAINGRAYERLCQTVQPLPGPAQIRFVTGNFSSGLPLFASEAFDGVVSGLAIQYAECYSEQQGCWTTEAYDHLLAEIWRVLRPGGRFIFSVNLPEPAWGRVALGSLSGIFQTRQPGRFLKNSWRMLRYGAWLSREARRGRFHYLPLSALSQKLGAAGFSLIQHRLTYAGQAYLIRCIKADDSLPAEPG
jgi:ubiquinone/menaquinone biosynthesis C-methylase UbiE